MRERGSSVGSGSCGLPSESLRFVEGCAHPPWAPLCCSRRPVVEVGGSSLEELLHGGLTYSWKLLGIASCIYLPIANVIIP